MWIFWLSVFSISNCTRYLAGTSYLEQEHLYSQNGVLAVTLSYDSSIDRFNNSLHCYTTPNQKQAPIMHLYLGDILRLTLFNNIEGEGTLGLNVALCKKGNAVSELTTNLNFHGTTALAACGQDDVINTLVNSGQSFTYNLQIPIDESPGMNFYHPHVFPYTEAAVQGGASGAIIIEGFENVQSAVVGLRQRIMIIRDNIIHGSPLNAPSWDISLNYIPIPFPSYPAVPMRMKLNEKQLFRIVNACANTILNITLLYDGVPQPLEVVEIDGVAVNSNDVSQQSTSIVQFTILMGPSARSSFIVLAPDQSVISATLYTMYVDTGSTGSNDPTRPIATILLDNTSDELTILPSISTLKLNRTNDIAFASIIRYFQFSQMIDPNDENESNYYITEKGAALKKFTAGQAPSIQTTQGSMEEWVIENNTTELYVFINLGITYISTKLTSN